MDVSWQLLTRSKIHHRPTLHLHPVGADVVATDKCTESAHHRGNSARHEVVDTPQACRCSVLTNKGKAAGNETVITPNNHGIQDSIAKGAEAKDGACRRGAW